MKYSEKLHASAKSRITYASQAETALSLQVKESQYTIGGVQTFCWLIQTEPPHRDALPSFAVLMYSAPCGLIEIKLSDPQSAEEVFHLFTKYEVSPYHAEDIIEDREIHASIRFL